MERDTKMIAKIATDVTLLQSIGRPVERIKVGVQPAAADDMHLHNPPQCALLMCCPPPSLPLQVYTRQTYPSYFSARSPYISSGEVQAQGGLTSRPSLCVSCSGPPPHTTYPTHTHCTCPALEMQS